MKKSASFPEIMPQLIEKAKDKSYSILKSVESIDEITNVVTIKQISGTKPKHWQEQEFVSPDKKRTLVISELIQRKWISTSVNIWFGDVYCPVYQVNIIHPKIKPYWKDNNTVIIETIKKDTLIQYKTVSHLSDVIHIEYVRIAKG